MSLRSSLRFTLAIVLLMPTAGCLTNKNVIKRYDFLLKNTTIYAHTVYERMEYSLSLQNNDHFYYSIASIMSNSVIYYDGFYTWSGDSLQLSFRHGKVPYELAPFLMKINDGASLVQYRKELKSFYLRVEPVEEMILPIMRTSSDRQALLRFPVR